MTIESWSRLPAAETARLYRAEQARLHEVLDWDTAATWRLVEHARVSTGLAGLVARDPAGAIAGWTFFVERHGEVQVGGLTATAAAVRPLVGALMRSPEVARAAQIRIFGCTDAPGLADALAVHGFAVGGYDYLVAPLTASAAAPDGVARRWRPADLGGAAALMAAAYGGHDPLRPFGGSGRGQDWMEYVLGLITTTGCGVFAPELTRVAAGAGGGLDALALVTRLGPSTAHLAQLAVDPASQGHGLGARLLDAAVHAAAAAGLPAMSLLVGAANTRARALYHARGFRYAASFISAVAVGQRTTGPASVASAVSSALLTA